MQLALIIGFSGCVAKSPVVVPTRPTVEQESAKAEFNLGLAYYKGEGVPKDVTQAVQLWRKAADEGYAPAQTALGSAYLKGEGVPRDPTQAVEWWRKAAGQGDAAARNNLALAYQNGEGVPKDPTKAAELWRTAADQGYAPAQTNLGIAEKREAILRLLDMTQPTAIAMQTRDAILQQMKRMFPTVPEALWQELASEFKMEEFRELVIPIYARHFSLEDLNALIAFYSTPMGQRVIHELPAIAGESMAIGAQWGQAKAREMVQRLQAQGYQQRL
jgi:hypothetical protein